MKKISNILLIILILVQPILDSYIMYYNPSLELFGFKYSTIIRYMLIFLMGIIILYKTKAKKWRKTIILYSILLFIYAIGHHLNAQNFTSLNPNGIGYSFLEEMLYISRYIIPLIIIYYINSIEIDKNLLKKTIILYSLAISSLVIISNIFYFAKASYSNVAIEYNIIDWFIKDINYLYAASKGIFYSTSIITTLLIVTPYIFSLYYKENKLIYLTAIVFNMLALFMVGTRACTYGFIIISVLMLIMYIFFSVLKKNIKFELKHVITSIFIICLSFFILQYSPTSQRVGTMKIANGDIKNPDKQNPNNIVNLEDQKTSNQNIEELKQIVNSDSSNKEEQIISFISKNKSYLGIYAPFLDCYSFEHDYIFWTNIIINEPVYNKNSNRYIEEQMLKRVKEINNNKLDNLFGITYSRTSKVFNLERDFLYQYYSMGIIGVLILIFPLLYFLITSIIKILIKKDYFNLKNCSLCLGIGLIFGVALYSGDVLDNVGTVTIIGVILGMLVENTSKKDEAKIKKV
ncbi:MAG: hypothetical protein HFI36_00085 [Bacilli bacterium]|nr:hypothetical protein [Bacilli bacterium]